jgi:hypothetical protein
MEGEEMLGLLRRAVAVVEERQSKLEKLEETIRLSSEAQRDQAVKRRIDLRAEIKASDGALAERLRHLILYVNKQIEMIDEMLGALRGA